MDQLPHFTFHPNATATGAIKREPITCSVCHQHRDYAYRGGIYSPRDAGDICPWCVADGSAAAQYEGCFVADFEPASDASLDEVRYRTPNYISWQGEHWLSHHGECCIFLDYVGGDDIRPLIADLQPDLRMWTEEMNCTLEHLLEWLRKDGTLTGYLFRCRVCGRHRLHVDAA